ncbi:uncharacterized protein LOC128210344 isoform X2 [Mya arenaria]|nr:uncharacterized protein LOC128210344 isoform X2 [Mya arenaria]
MQQCQEMYDRLHLDTDEEESEQIIPPFPLLRGHTMINQSRPLTYSLRTANKSSRPFSIRSAPSFMFKDDSSLTDNFKTFANEQTQETRTHTAKSANTDCDPDGEGHPRERGRMDSDQLREHLQRHGFGLPRIIHKNQVYRSASQTLPRNYKNRPLPKNPSKREKIKGRARLDQEMANLRALAFCEQQTQTKAFRTASANMRNRDVQFMEEELKEHLAREGNDVILDDDEDDNSSIVHMPMEREELFVRINTWVTEVESSCRVYNSHHDAVQEVR